ncbi:MAG: choice-of-anchor L domain-containing protein [Bacteroidia bacterium]|nr:choice-of-anchor L domain-containing protein [Bacteroidia bacterium]MDW8159659.1 choice-of-anchor L domain-containing protein [Bacteroidia bacterium]
MQLAAPFIALILLCSFATAQITTFQNLTPEELVKNVLVGTGVQVQNVVYSGSPEAIGYYERGSNGPSSIFPKGIILCTGRLRDVPGPNTNTNAPAPNRPRADYNNGAPGDLDLSNIIGARTFNAAVLEFDFIPSTDSVSFNFIFASEEYTEYVDKRYNDVFAFLISGPGIPPPGLNIALVPGTRIPVSINSINHLRNTQYYIDNEYVSPAQPAPHNIQYDGFTTPLVAKAKIPVPCQTYHLKLAIADVADAYWDSAVLLEAGSLSSPSYTVEITPGLIGTLEKPTTYEGCSRDIRLIFRRPLAGILPQERIDLQLGGNAQYGQDYLIDRNFIFFRSGALTDTLYLSALQDAEQDTSLEEVILRFRPTFACQTIEARVYIAEPELRLRLFPLQDTIHVCGRAGQNFLNLKAQAYGGRLRNVLYTWLENDNILPYNTSEIAITLRGSAKITVKSTFPACRFPELQASIWVQVHTPNLSTPFAASLTDTVVCPNTVVSLRPNVRNALGVVSYLWEDGSTAPSINFVINASRRVRVKVKDSCDSLVATARLEILQSRLTPKNITICRGQAATLALALQPAGSGYLVEWYNSQNQRIATGNPLVVRPISSTYYIARVAGYPCIQDTAFVEIQAPLEVTPPRDTTICLGQSVRLQARAQGGDGRNFSYLWQEETGGLVLANAPTLQHSPTVSTIYRLTVNNTCNTPQSFQIRVNVIPNTLSIDSVIFTTAHPQCIGQKIGLRAYVSGGSGTYTYHWQGNPASGQNFFETLLHQTTPILLQVNDGCMQKQTLVTARIVDPLQLQLLDTTVCANIPFTYRAIGYGGKPPYNWIWQDSAGNILSTNSHLRYQATERIRFRVSLQDACGNQVTNWITISVHPQLNANFINLQDTVLCFGRSVRFTIFPLTGVPPYSYQWRSLLTDSLIARSSTIDFIASRSMQIEAQVQDACTSLHRRIQVRVVPPTLKWHSFRLVPPPPFCQGQNVSLQVKAQGGSGNYTYRFPGLQNTSGNYQVTLNNSLLAIPVSVTDGCQIIDTLFSIEALPTLQARFQLSDTSLCRGERLWLQAIVRGGKPPYRYFWQDSVAGEVRFISADSVFSLLPGQSTFYRLWVQDACNQAIITSWQRVRIKSLPQIEISKDTAICQGDCAVLFWQVVPSQAQLRWTPPLTSQGSNGGRACPIQTTTYTLQALAEGCYAEAKSLTVTVRPSPQVRITTPPLAFCQGQDTARIFSQVQRGIPPYRYQWQPFTGIYNNSATTPYLVASPLQTTIYTLRVTDANGCWAKDSIKVTIHPLPVADAGEDTAICAEEGKSVKLKGKAILLDNISNFEYRWQPTLGLNNPYLPDPTATPPYTITYTLKVITKPLGCISMPKDSAEWALATVTVRVKPQPRAHIAPAKAICVGDTLELLALPQNAEAFFWYPQQNMQNSNSANPRVYPSFSQWYYLQIQQEGCLSKADSVFVRVKPRPTIRAGNSLQICAGDSVQLPTPTVSGAPAPYTYMWCPYATLSNSQAANPWAFPQTTTTYYVQVLADGCPSVVSDSLVVSVLPTPKIFLADTFVVYEKEPFSLPAQLIGIPNATFEWQPHENLSDPFLLNPMVDPRFSTTYTLVARYGQCSTQKITHVRVLRKFKAMAWAGRGRICAGDTVWLWGRKSRFSATATYWWKPFYNLSSQQGAIVKAYPQQTTTYTLTLSDSGYTDTAVVTIEVIPRPIAGFEVTPSFECDSFRIKIKDKSKFALFWLYRFGDSNVAVNQREPLYTYHYPGNYQIRQIVKNELGCQDSAFQKVKVLFPKSILVDTILSSPAVGSVLYLPNSEISFYPHPFQANSGSWLWLFGDGNSSQSVAPVHRYTLPGEYYVEVWQEDKGGCKKKFRLGPYIIKEPELQIPNVFTPNNDGVNDSWQPLYLGTEKLKCQIFDRWGIQVFVGEGNALEWDGRNQEGKAVEEGTYFYVIQVGERSYRGTITVLR